MFNLLEQGAAPNIKDFLFNFKEVMILEGWTVNYYGDNITDNGTNGDKLVISDGTNHYYFASAIKTAGNIFGFTGLTGTTWETDFEGLSLYYLPEYVDENFGTTMYEYNNGYPLTEDVNCCLTNGIIENYWIYKNDGGGYLAVIEYEVGTYTQFYFGGVKMFDQSRTIAQLWSASVCETYPYIPELTDHRPLFADGNGRGSGYRSHLYYNGDFYTKYNGDNNIEVSKAVVDTFMGITSSISRTASFPNVMISNSGGKVYQGDGSVMGRTKVKFNDKNFPISTKVWTQIDEIYNEMYFPFYEVDGFYSINFETIQPTEVLTFGLNEFICFPHYQKNNPQNVVDDVQGRGLGIALKIGEA